MLFDWYLRQLKGLDDWIESFANSVDGLFLRVLLMWPLVAVGFCVFFPLLIVGGVCDFLLNGNDE